MIEADIDELEAFQAELEDLEGDLEDFRRKGHHKSMWAAIEDAVDDNIQNPILQRAKERASQHVGSDRAQTIAPIDGSWSGDQYTTGIGSDNVVVMSHAKGTGSHSTGGPYRITPDTGDKLVFESNGRTVAVDYVVHPGVRGKQFMQKAISRNMDDVMGDVLEEVMENAEDAL